MKTIEEAAAELHATSARYDKRKRRVVVELQNDVAVWVEPAMISRKLHGAAPADLAGVTISASGKRLIWEKLGVRCSLPRLMESLFGPGGWKRAAAKRAVQVRAAAREHDRRPA